MAMSNAEVGCRIRDARCLKGMTQARLADASACSAPHISQIENGDTSVRVCEIVLIARCLGVDPRCLLTGIASEGLELAVALSPKTQDRGVITLAAELIQLVKCFFSKTPLQQRKVLSLWKGVLEMA